MFKNFSPPALGINGRQSEMIELALTYAFSGLDIDMTDMVRRTSRTNAADATKYLTSAARAYEQQDKPLNWGGFNTEINLDADEDTFNAAVANLSPVADLAHDIGLTRGYISIPAGTDRLPYQEYFEHQKNRIGQVSEVLASREIKLGLLQTAGSNAADELQFEFVRTVEHFSSLVKACGENVGYVINTWDWRVGGGGMSHLETIDVSDIVAVILSSVTPDVDVEAATVTDRVLPIVEGDFPHTELLKHLKTIGYEGPVSPGCSPLQYKGQTRESIVKESQENIDAIFEAAGLEVIPLPMDLIEDIPYETSTSIT